MITRLEESYRVWFVCVCVCVREASIIRKTWSTRGCCTMEKINVKEKLLSLITNFI